MVTRVLALFALLALLCAPACAQQEWEREYGGSGADVLTDLIAAGDGLLAVGYTDSTDGDLSMRTRTGMTGWMLRLDGEGNALWSCCTARRGRDRMHSPYAHADGTFSAMLTGEGRGGEWLRISEEARVDARIELPEPDAACSHGQAKALYGLPLEKDGALALVVTHEDGTNCYALMRQDGEILPGAQVYPHIPDGVMEVSIDGSGRLVAVYPADGNAQIVLIEPGSAEPARVFPVQIDSGKLQLIISALPCEDGSVIFNGQIYEIGNVLLRVNAEGGTIFMRDDCEFLSPLAHTQVGFAGVDSDEIIFFDEDGADVLLVVEDRGGEARCLRLGSDGTMKDDNASMPDMPPEHVFDLPAGRLTWQGAQQGAVVTLSNAAGNVLWQTFTRINTPADSVQWLCAAQTDDGRILLGGRYLSQILGDSEEKAFRRELTQDGLMQEGVVVQLSTDGVLLGMNTIKDIGSILGIAPGRTDRETLLMGVRSDMTHGDATNLIPLDQSDWAVLDILMQPEDAYLLSMPDGSVLAAGTQLRNGKSTVILQRAHL